jgi:hypothetical protein
MNYYAKQPLHYYEGKLTFNSTLLPNNATFSNAQLPNIITVRTVFTDSIMEAKNSLLDYAQKFCLVGEIVVRNMRSNEVVFKAQYNFKQF